MGAVKKVDKEDIKNVAYNILRNSGLERLNVRSLAKELKCSTKPIYFQFKNMDAIKEELKLLSEQRYIEIANECIGKYSNDYLSHGMAYVKFAKDEKNLFRYLYLSGREQSNILQIDDANYDEIIESIVRKYGISQKLAQDFHFDMAIYSYGLAVMINTGFLEISDEEIEVRLMTQGKSLKGFYVDKKGE